MCIDITIHADDIVENEEYFVVWFDISSDVRIIPGVNSSLVIITEVIIVLYISSNIIQMIMIECPNVFMEICKCLHEKDNHSCAYAAIVTILVHSQMRTDEQALPVGGISGAAVAVVICMITIIAVTVVLVCIVRHKRLQQKLQKHRTSL